MNAKESKGPDQGKKKLQGTQDQPESDVTLLDTGLEDQEEGESHEDEGGYPDR